MKKIVVLFILFITVQLVAQKQKLEYLDEPLPVVIIDLETKFSIRFSFNSSLLKNKAIHFSGFSTLKEILSTIKQQTDLEFQFVDHQNIIIKKGVINPNITITALDEVLISNEYLTTGFDKNEKDGSIKVTPDDLGILPGLTEPDVLQSLQLLPGISSPTESASDIHIRGGTPDQNLVLWDGIKMYHQGHFFGQISAFNPYITESINVFRSGTSAKYGDRVSGVIDIHSSDKVHDNLTVGMGANLIQADAFIKTPIVKDQLSITASIRRSYSDLLNTFTFQKMSTKVFQNTKIDGGSNIYYKSSFEELKNKFYFTDYNIKTVWQPNDNHSIRFSSLFVINKLDYASKNKSLGSEDELSSTDNLALSNNGFNLSWDATLTKQLKLNTKAYLSNYESNYGYQDTYGPNDLYETNVINDIKDLGAGLGFTYTHNKNHTSRFGYDLVSNSIIYQIDSDYNNETPYQEKDNDKLNIHALFYEFVFEKNKWTLQTGVRVNYISTIKKKYIEPRLFFNYKINNAWNLKVSTEVKNQSISKVLSSTQNNLGLGNSLWILADDNRPILNNKQFSIGMLYEKKGWKLDIDGYYKKTKGLTSLKNIFNLTEGEATFNKGRSESFGIDLLIKKRINNFRSWLSYSLSKTNYLFEKVNNGNWYLGNFDQTHVLSFSNTYTYNNFQFSLGWNIATGKPQTKAIAVNNEFSEITYEDINASRLNTYHKLDASVVYDFYLNNKKSVKARVGASVINIYNRENELEKTYRLDSQYNSNTDTITNKIIEQTNYGLGFTPNFVFRLNF